MKAAIVLHLYQPPVQEESVLKLVASECYIPLIKFLKNRKNHRFTLNIPLSLLELMDKYGYKSWINEIKSLHESEKIELTGSGAYHPLLTEIPQKVVEEEIVLNEYGLGYYFGSTQGFEGEPSVLIKNIHGFFPPELAVNQNLIETLSSFGYKWVLCEKTALIPGFKGEGSVFSVKDTDLKVVCRDRDLSNMLSFKRDMVPEDLVSYIESKRDLKYPTVIALDGEYFGHHFKEGLFLLENLLDRLDEHGVVFDTVSNILEEFGSVEIDGIGESSWGASDEEFSHNDIYPYWISSDNELQVLLWKLQKLILSNYISDEFVVNSTELQNVPVWDSNEINNVKEENIRNNINNYILVNKFIHSDKFWWSSNKEILGKKLYHPGLVENAMKIAEGITKYYKDGEKITEVKRIIEEIRELLK